MDKLKRIALGALILVMGLAWGYLIMSLFVVHLQLLPTYIDVITGK